MNASDDEKEFEPWDFWNQLVITSSSYCIAGFFFSLAASSKISPLSAVFVGGLFFAMTQLTSIFAALGSENYWKRLLITQTCLAFFGLSVIGGFGIGIENQNTRIPGLSNAVAFTTIASSFGSQVMFGFFRFVGNWRFHHELMPRGPIYSLKDLFAVTTYLFVSLAALGALVPKGAMDDLPGVFMTAAFVLVATLVYGVPTLLFTLSSKDSEYGCFAQLIILVTIGFLVIVPFVAMGATPVIMPLLLLLCSSALFTWVPLAFMHQRGFVLTRRKKKSDDT